MIEIFGVFQEWLWQGVLRRNDIIWICFGYVQEKWPSGDLNLRPPPRYTQIYRRCSNHWATWPQVQCRLGVPYILLLQLRPCDRLQTTQNCKFERFPTSRLTNAKTNLYYVISPKNTLSQSLPENPENLDHLLDHFILCLSRVAIWGLIYYSVPYEASVSPFLSCLMI